MTEEKRESFERMVKWMAATCALLTAVNAIANNEDSDARKSAAIDVELALFMRDALRIYPNGQLPKLDLQQLAQAFGVQLTILDLGKMPAAGEPVH